MAYIEGYYIDQFTTNLCTSSSNNWKKKIGVIFLEIYTVILNFICNLLEI